MKFYKIVDSENGNYGIFHKEGINVSEEIFDPKSNDTKNGIYFHKEDIFSFAYFGKDVYEVEPLSEVYDSLNKRFKCEKVNLKHIGKLSDLKTIKHLVEDGANIHAENNHLFCFACEKGYLDIVKYLVELGVDVKTQEDYPICLASEYGHLEVVKFLVKQGADIHYNYDFPFRYASENGYLEIVKYLAKNGADIFIRDNYALRWSAINGHLEVVKYLVEQGADIHVEDDCALRFSALYGYLEIVKYLVSKGANVKAISKKFLKEIILSERHDVIEFLKLCK